MPSRNTGSAGSPPASIRDKAGEPPALPATHSRGYLPHVEGAEYQLITYRLADALPAEAIARLQILPKKNRRVESEAIMDAGYGKCWLARPEIAALMIDNWQHFNGKRYSLLAYVVMPNHVHVLIRVFNGMTLSRIVHSWKSYTAKRIVNLLSEAGEAATSSVWQVEYWDRYIRNQAHYDAVVAYIHNNPVKAGLVQQPENWRWSSAWKG